MADERNLVDEEDAVKENSTKNPREKKKREKKEKKEKKEKMCGILYRSEAFKTLLISSIFKFYTLFFYFKIVV